MQLPSTRNEVAALLVLQLETALPIELCKSLSVETNWQQLTWCQFFTVGNHRQSKHWKLQVELVRDAADEFTVDARFDNFDVNQIVSICFNFLTGGSSTSSFSSSNQQRNNNKNNNNNNNKRKRRRRRKLRWLIFSSISEMCSKSSGRQPITNTSN